ncbi:neutral zinc metallopeptidase [soil metagenome]
MQLGDQEGSSNVEDRRGMGIGGGVGVGGVVIAVIAYFLGFDPSTALQVAQQVAPKADTREATKGVPKDESGVFVSKVLGSTEKVWSKMLPGYRAPTLVLYDGQVRTACGTGQSAMGPFYCAGDEKLYIDLTFFRELKSRFGAPGDFAQAYVIAHEIGHHVQKLTGALDQRDAARGSSSQAEARRTSVRMELQADCYAGVWGYHAGAMKQLDSGDINEALAAATAIGDDRLQKQAQGRVVPETFTHGSSEQRVRWFKRGVESGQPKDCDTFSASSL